MGSPINHLELSYGCEKGPAISFNKGNVSDLSLNEVKSYLVIIIAN